MDSDEGGARSVKVVHGHHVLVVIGSGHRLVGQMVRIRYGVEVEGPGGIIAC